MFGNSNTGNKSAEGIGGGTSPDEFEGGADLTVTSESKCLEEHEPTADNSTDELSRPKTPHQPFFFKFSLEWMDRPQWPTKNKRLFTPCLPVASQIHVQQRRSPAKSITEFDTASEGASTAENTVDENPSEISIDKDTVPEPALELVPEPQLRTATTKDSPLPGLPSAPAFDHLVPSKYAGRALAEWAHIVSECDSFFARRRDEGVPTDRMVETPTLGVDSFRK
jgi:hypothetical protein